MTAIAIHQFTDTTSGGASATAGFITQQIYDWHQQLQESYILGQKGKGSLNELYSVFDECRQPNWDGYGAVPVSERTFRIARAFLEALPLGEPAPSVGAEPDGHITLEWYSSPRQTLSVSVSPEGQLHYAALIDAENPKYATESFYGYVPRIIIELIHRVVVA